MNVIRERAGIAGVLRCNRIEQRVEDVREVEGGVARDCLPLVEDAVDRDAALELRVILSDEVPAVRRRRDVMV